MPDNQADNNLETKSSSIVGSLITWFMENKELPQQNREFWQAGQIAESQYKQLFT